MKSITKLSVLLLAALTCAAGPAMAQDPTTPATNTAPAAPKPARSNPRYTGTISSIDSANMILTLKVTNHEDKKVKITSATKIRKDRQPATFSDAVVGLHVSGAGKKGDDGVWTATTLLIQTKAPAPNPPPAAQGQ
jgi:hypothetical protein